MEIPKSTITEALNRMRLFDNTNEQQTHVVIVLTGDPVSPMPTCVVTVKETDNTMTMSSELREVTEQDIAGLTEYTDETEKATRALGILEVLNIPFAGVVNVCTAKVMANELEKQVVTAKDIPAGKEKEIPVSDPMAVFKNMALPLMEYLDSNYHPHTQVIVTSTRAELYEEKMAVTNTSKHS